MKNTTVIAHFYNEEYLLPFWLRHHLTIFDNGILINHGSTDKSVDIIKDLAPDWQIIESELEIFDPYFTDFEVQTIESKTIGWKICLNITEFLVGPLQDVVNELENNNVRAVYTQAKIMVDTNPIELPTHSADLTIQKPHGILDNKLYDTLIRGPLLKKILRFLIFPTSRFIGRQRLLHNQPIGQYTVGRHQWGLDAKLERRLTVYWYSYAPWNNIFINRKLNISDTMPKITNGLGDHHKFTRDKLQKQYNINKIWYYLQKFYQVLRGKA